MMSNDEAISILNGLIEISKDGEEGFLQSSEIVDDPAIQRFFLRRSNEVKQSVLELQDLVRELGGKPADSTTIGGYLHRRWIDLKTAIVNDDNLAVVVEVERGEEAALSKYREAASKDLPPRLIEVIIRQLNGAQRNYDQVKQLREKSELQAH
jgi:uncharacterized protein (TIGR02284 family)